MLPNVSQNAYGTSVFETLTYYILCSRIIPFFYKSIRQVIASSP